MHILLTLIVVAFTCSGLSAVDINDYLKGNDEIIINDGKFTYIYFKKDGSYTYCLSDNGNTGHVSIGKWKQDKEMIEMIGSWNPLNSFGSNKTKIFTMKIEKLTPVENINNTYSAFYYFDEIRYNEKSSN